MNILLKILLFLAILMGGLALFFIFFKPVEKIETSCINQEQVIPITLQSGEKGKVYISDRGCEFADKKKAELRFITKDDGSLEDSIFQSRLYIWKRDESMSAEEQIRWILSNVYNKDDCIITKDEFKNRDDIDVYRAQGECSIFGLATEFSSEIFMEVNGLLIAERQEGFDGIEPYNLASIRFVKD